MMRSSVAKAMSDIVDIKVVDVTTPGAWSIVQRQRELHWLKLAKPHKCLAREYPYAIADMSFKHPNRGISEPGDHIMDYVFAAEDLGVWSTSIWVEVTEAADRDVHERLNQYLHAYNVTHAEADLNKEFWSDMAKQQLGKDWQRRMCDRIGELVSSKAAKGRPDGSYSHLKHEYGPGILVVGVPMWFPPLPSIALIQSPSIHDQSIGPFMRRFAEMMPELRHGVLETHWCPFDSVQILWQPMSMTPESLKTWLADAADSGLLNTDTWPTGAAQGNRIAKGIANVAGDLPLGPSAARLSWHKHATLLEALNARVSSIRHQDISCAMHHMARLALT